MDSDTAYCRDLVERFDHDRYILTLAAPESLRSALWAVYAFNHEIAKTREVTRDVHAGHVRLAWWREHLNAFYNGADMPAHDVARALGRAIRAHNLPEDNFDKILGARAFDLDSSVPASLDGMMRYADATNTPLIDLSAQILNVPAPQNLGTAWGLIGIVRALPWYARQNRCVLPLPMLHDIGLMPEQFHHLKSSPALSKAVSAIAELAGSHLNDTPTERFFRAQQRMARLYLKRIEKAQYDPFNPHIHRSVPFLGLRVLF